MLISDWISDGFSSDLPRRHRAHAGVGAYAFGEHRQMIGLPKIVRVEEGDPVATRRPDADIAPRIPPRSRRREIEQLDPLVADRGRQFAPAVGRAIVDHEYLMRGKALDRKSTRLNSSH